MDENDKAMKGILLKDLTSDMKVIVPGPSVHTVKQLLDISCRNALSTEPVVSCSTGHWKIDRMSGGMREGFVWLIGGETNFGKSSYAVMQSDEAIAAGKRPLLVSFEDALDIYGDRLMCRRARVSADRLRDRELTPAEMGRVTEVANSGQDVPFFIDASDEPVERLVAALDIVIREYDIDVVFFDYIQEAVTELNFENERLKYKAIGAMLRRVVKRHRKTGAILTQLTGAAGEKPNKYSVRDCKDLANAAEAVMFGWRPKQDVLNDDGTVRFREGDRVMVIDKMKQGKTGLVKMSWDENSACFDRELPPSDIADELLYDAKSAAAGDYGDFQDGLGNGS